MVLFKFPLQNTENRPLEFEIHGPSASGRAGAARLRARHLARSYFCSAATMTVCAAGRPSSPPAPLRTNSTADRDLRLGDRGEAGEPGVGVLGAAAGRVALLVLRVLELRGAGLAGDLDAGDLRQRSRSRRRRRRPSGPRSSSPSPAAITRDRLLRRARDQRRRDAQAAVRDRLGDRRHLERGREDLGLADGGRSQLERVLRACRRAGTCSASRPGSSACAFQPNRSAYSIRPSAPTFAPSGPKTELHEWANDSAKVPPHDSPVRVVEVDAVEHRVGLDRELVARA